ncbi:MAG: histidine phosphatase family protein [Micromonosporaceae bacterium]|nr:histidine phosphatase family protein [Micromonosporaceae bacterium]
MNAHRSYRTYVLRHGRTRHSARHITDGQPAAPVRLDHVGQQQCRDLAATAGWLAEIESCVTSEFPRARETADLLLAGHAAHRVTDPRLNEIDYGRFEGRPWMEYGAWLRASDRHAIPPDGVESRDDAVRRMLEALRDCLSLPGPRLVVTHGLLLSILVRLAAYQPIDELALPEAPCVTPLAFPDARLSALVQRGLVELDSGARNPSGRASTGRYAVQVPPTSDLES